MVHGKSVRKQQRPTTERDGPDVCTHLILLCPYCHNVAIVRIMCAILIIIPVHAVAIDDY